MAPQTRERILVGARWLLAKGEKPTVGRVAEAAGVSRASFYRAFESRRALLEALEGEPEPGAKGRILEAAAAMVGADSPAALSVGELGGPGGGSPAPPHPPLPRQPALFPTPPR